MAGKETLRNSLMTDTGFLLSFSRMERNAVGGRAGALSSLGTAERQLEYGVHRESANSKRGVTSLAQALRKKDPEDFQLLDRLSMFQFFPRSQNVGFFFFLLFLFSFLFPLRIE